MTSQKYTIEVTCVEDQTVKQVTVEAESAMAAGVAAGEKASTKDRTFAGGRLISVA